MSVSSVPEVIIYVNSDAVNVQRRRASIVPTVCVHSVMIVTIYRMVSASNVLRSVSDVLQEASARYARQGITC